MDKSAHLNSDREKSGGVWKARLHAWSRDPNLLLATVAIIVGVAGWQGWTQRGPELFAQEGGHAALKNELTRPVPDIEAILARMAEAGSAPKNEADVRARIQASQLSAAHKSVVAAYWESVIPGLDEPNADLLYFAHYIYPVPYANELVGDFHKTRGNIGEAIRYYRREVQAGSKSAARKLTELLIATGDVATLREFANHRSFLDKLPPDLKLTVLAKERRWGEVPGAIKELHFKTPRPRAMLIAVAASLVWLLIAVHAGQPASIVSFRTIAPLFALVAGIASSAAAIVAGLWQEQMIQMPQSELFGQAMLAFIAGVAPREELAKLVFVLPFVPFFLHRKERLEMLVVSGCVGIGFAVATNGQGFVHGASAVAFGRFLSATFFHFAATALFGLALSELILQPLKKAAPFALTAAGVIFANGCYHAFTAVPQFSALSLISMISFMLLALAFCRKLAGFRDAHTESIAVSATFVVGVALLTGLVLVCAAIEIGFLSALLGLAATLFTLAMVVTMVFWQLGDALASSEANRPRPYAQ